MMHGEQLCIKQTATIIQSVCKCQRTFPIPGGISPALSTCMHERGQPHLTALRASTPKAMPQADRQAGHRPPPCTIHCVSAGREHKVGCHSVKNCSNMFKQGKLYIAVQLAKECQSSTPLVDSQLQQQRVILTGPA